MRQERTKQKCWPHIMLLTYMMLVTHEPLWLIRSERRAGEPRAWARQDAAAIKEEDEDNGDDSDDSDDGDGRRRGRGGGRDEPYASRPSLAGCCLGGGLHPAALMHVSCVCVFSYTHSTVSQNIHTKIVSSNDHPIILFRYSNPINGRFSKSSHKYVVL